MFYNTYQCCTISRCSYIWLKTRDIASATQLKQQTVSSGFVLLTHQAKYHHFVVYVGWKRFVDSTFLFLSAVSTGFGSGGVRSDGFHTIDASGLFDTGLTSDFDTGVKSSQYDITLKSGQYDTGVKSSQYASSIKSGQYDVTLKSGGFDTGVKSGQYDGSLKSGQYDTGVRSVQYDTSVRSGQYDTLDGILPTFSWSTTTLPSSSAAVMAGGSSYTYQAGTNNMPGGSSPVGLTSPSSLSGESRAPPPQHGLQPRCGVW